MRWCWESRRCLWCEPSTAGTGLPSRLAKCLKLGAFSPSRSQGLTLMLPSERQSAPSAWLVAAQRSSGHRGAHGAQDRAGQGAEMLSSPLPHPISSLLPGLSMTPTSHSLLRGKQLPRMDGEDQHQRVLCHQLLLAASPKSSTFANAPNQCYPTSPNL